MAGAFVSPPVTMVTGYNLDNEKPQPVFSSNKESAINTNHTTNCEDRKFSQRTTGERAPPVIMKPKLSPCFML